MPSLQFDTYPIWISLAIFAATAGVVWSTGVHLSRCADAIAEQTGLGRPFVGLLLLAAATSLPELSTTTSASLAGNAPLAVNNLFGSVVANTAVLVVADLFVAEHPLSFVTPRSVLLFEGAAVVLLVAIALGGIVAADMGALFGVGLWTILVFGVYVLSTYFLKQYQEQERWQPVDEPPKPKQQDKEKRAQEQRYKDTPTWQLGLRFLGAALVIFAAGWMLASAGDALARQTGLGGSFVGFALLALATSLPELSTTITAVRLGSYSMAFSNIFGSSAFVMALLLPADLLYRQGPILGAADRSSTFAGIAGIAVTTIYLMGLIERRDRQVLRLGADSVVVLVLYAGSLVVMYALRS